MLLHLPLRKWMHREVKDLAEAHTAADSGGPPLAMPSNSAPLLLLQEEAERPAAGGRGGHVFH